MIGRLFFIIAIFLLGWLAFRYFRTQIKLKQVKQKKSNTHIEEIKPCAFCGLHMPTDEMLKKDSLHFCSYQHIVDFDDKS